jgi:hypothetical protein
MVVALPARSQERDMRRANEAWWVSTAVTLLAACGPQPVTGRSAAGLVPLEIADLSGSWGKLTIDEVAYRDGDGPWRQLALTEGHGTIEVNDPFGRFAYAVSQHYTFPALVGPETTQVVYTTVAESPHLPLTGNAEVFPAPPAPKPNVSFEGVEFNDSVFVGFGAASDLAFGREDGIAEMHLPSGQADMLVVHSSWTESPRVLLSRGQRLPSGTAPFDLSEALDTVEVPVQVLGAAPGSTLETWSTVATSGAGGTNAGLGRWIGAPDEARLRTLPPSVSAEGDTHTGFFWARDRVSNSQGVVLTWRHSTRDLEARLPPALPIGAGWDAASQPTWRWTGAGAVSASLTLTSGMPGDSSSFSVTRSFNAIEELTFGDTSGAPVLDTTLAAHTTAASSWALTLLSEGASQLCGSWANACFVTRTGSFRAR